jgi:hypothetical protein
MNNFSPSNTDFRINGRELTNWGTASPPLTIEYIDAQGTLIRGEGSGALALYRDNPGVRITVNMLPGSPDSSYLKGLKTSRANLTASHTVIGTLEALVAAEGIFVNEGAMGRAGTTTVTDDVYIMEFNTEDSSKGGDA